VTYRFKYGELRRAELNYSGNLKARSENKIYVKLFGNSKDGVHRINANSDDG
jgi:hypothetical protein